MQVSEIEAQVVSQLSEMIKGGSLHFAFAPTEIMILYEMEFSVIELRCIISIK